MTLVGKKTGERVRPDARDDWTLRLHDVDATFHASHFKQRSQVLRHWCFHLSLSLSSSTSLTYTASHEMARGIEGNEIATPRAAPKKTGGSTQKSGSKQQSIAGFFKRTPGPAPSSIASQPKPPSFNTALKEPPSSADATPVPSSLPVQSSSPQPEPESSQPGPVNVSRNKENGELCNALT